MSKIAEAKRRIEKCIDNQETELNLSSFGLDDLEKEVPELKECIHLTVLYLRFNRLSDCNVLKNLYNLTVLDVRNNKLKNLAGLSQLFNLKELYLYHNQVNDLSPLKSLNKLNILDINGNFISDLDPLVNLQNLEILKIANNDICDVSPLSNLQNLIVLNLSENKRISNINPLINLFNLHDLKVVYSQTTDFRPLLLNKSYQTGNLNVFADVNPVAPELEKAVNQGYESLKAYYDTLDAEGKIPNDQLKVILLGNSTAGKTSLLRYWGRKEFSEQQTTTHGIATWMDIPLQGNTPEQTFRVNAWDFGGQDYYHATHRLFITPDSTYVLVCHQDLENRRGEELTTEYMLINGVETPVQVPVQHYPYRFWLDTLAFLTKAGSIEVTTNQDHSRLPKLFLVENKCGTYQHNQQMRLGGKLTKTLPFEVIGSDFYHLDIREAWRYGTGQDVSDEANEFHLAYKKFEKQLLQTLRTQIENNRYEVHANFPKIRDILARMADDLQNTTVQSELAQLLDDSKIATIESYEKLPVWISYAQYQDIVQRNSKSKFEDIEGFLHTYLQNLCGRIFHFKDIPALADIVFIDPNWLHQSIYKVLSQEVLDQQGFFTLQDADRVIDGNILEADTFMEVMKAFELVFEVPQQSLRQFVAPQYLPMQCPLSVPKLKKEKETNHKLALTLQFEHYLPPSLISRIISLKGHLIKDQDEPFWRNGLIYTEKSLSTLVICTPESRTIEVFLGHANDSVKQQVLRDFMAFMEEKFSNELGEVLLSLPEVDGKALWTDIKEAVKGSESAIANHHKQGRKTLDIRPFWFLVATSETCKPLRQIFISHASDDVEYLKIVEERLKQTFNKYPHIDIWSDQGLRSGEDWEAGIAHKLQQTDCIIVLASSFALKSSWVQREIKTVKQQGGKVIPVFIEPLETHDNWSLISAFQSPSKDPGGSVIYLNQRKDELRLICNTLADRILRDLKAEFKVEK